MNWILGVGLLGAAYAWLSGGGPKPPKWDGKTPNNALELLSYVDTAFYALQGMPYDMATTPAILKNNVDVWNRSENWIADHVEEFGLYEPENESLKKSILYQQNRIRKLFDDWGAGSQIFRRNW